MPKSKLSTELEAGLRKRLEDELKQPPVEFPESKQYPLEVTINGERTVLGYVDVGFKFESKIVLCEVETMGFPAANLARMLSFCHHTKEPKEIYLFHFFAPTPYFKNMPKAAKVTMEFLIKNLESYRHIRYYQIHLEGNLPAVLRDLPEDQIDRTVKQFVKQILKQIKSKNIGIPWKLNK